MNFCELIERLEILAHYLQSKTASRRTIGIFQIEGR